MTLIKYGVVDSEDGVLLLGDAAILQLWRGSDKEHMQSSRIVSTLKAERPGINVSISHGEGVIWDMEGAGTADIFFDETKDHLMIIRCWLIDPNNTESDEQAISTLSAMPADLNASFAEFDVNSGYWAVFSTAESGGCITNNNKNYHIAQGKMLSKTSGSILPITNGHYRCYHDEVEIEQGEARRCHIISVRTVAGDDVRLHG